MAEPSLPNNHHTSKLESEVQYDEARVIFNKTIDGHYRHSKAGYRKVGALFLTWKDDDMLCKETEVGTYKHLHKGYTLTHGIRWTS